MDFPIAPFMDEGACYDWLVWNLHPQGLACPRCGRKDRMRVHRRHREPVLDYCCGCRRVFNAFTGTVFHKTRRKPSELVLIIRGIAQGQATSGLARELRRDRHTLLDLRHKLQNNAQQMLDRSALAGPVVECDELYQNAGEKRRPTSRPGRPAAAKGQQGQGPRHVGQRSTPGLRHRPARRRPDPVAGRTPQRPGVAPALGRTLLTTHRDGQHR